MMTCGQDLRQPPRPDLRGGEGYVETYRSAPRLGSARGTGMGREIVDRWWVNGKSLSGDPYPSGPPRQDASRKARRHQVLRSFERCAGGMAMRSRVNKSGGHSNLRPHHPSPLRWEIDAAPRVPYIPLHPFISLLLPSSSYICSACPLD